jgi:hypothetical protein
MAFRSMEQLSIAKLIYLEGIKYSEYDSLINNKLAIVNFDLSAATLIIALCYEKGKATRSGSGRTFDWPRLIEVLKNECNYKNDHLINRINDLHYLRNSVQHGDDNPGYANVQQYKSILLEFFIDICKKKYRNRITFESISLSKLLKSSDETKLIELLESYINKKVYSKAFNLIIISFLYRYQLIKINIEPKSLLRYAAFYTHPYWQRKSQGHSDPIQDQFEMLSDGLADSRYIISLGEYYYKLIEILQREVPNIDPKYTLAWIGRMTKLNYTIGRDRIIKLYEELNTFLFGTENLVTLKQNNESPIFYDAYIDNITENSAKINFKLFKGHPLDQFEVFLNNQRIPNPNNFNIGDGMFVLDNLSGSTHYECKMYATQEAGEFPRTRGDAEFTFDTI